MNIRRQLTLFINEADKKEIEAVRKKFNSAQYALLNTHVTLRREDEIKELQQIIENLKNIQQKPISIYFKKVERFSDGKGVLISGNNDTVLWMFQIAITLSFVFIAGWLFFNMKFKNKDKKWFRIIFSRNEWEPVLKAIELNNEIADFKREK